MKKFLKKITIIILLAFLLGNCIAWASLWALRNSHFYKPAFLVNGVEEDTFDYIILGASTGLTTLDTQQIDEQAGTRGLNLAMDDTGIASSMLMLQHFLAEGKSTDYVVLAPSINSYNTNEIRLSDNDHRFLMFVNRDYVNEYYQQFTERNFASNLLSASSALPLLGVSYYNAEIFYPSGLALLQSKRRNRFDGDGNYTYPVKEKSFGTQTTKTLRISFENPYLSKLESLCEQYQIKLLYYIAPIQFTDVNIDPTSIPVIDHSDLIERPSQFYDKIHVNTLGRKETSRKFAEVLRQLGIGQNLKTSAL